LSRPILERVLKCLCSSSAARRRSGQPFNSRPLLSERDGDRCPASGVIFLRPVEAGHPAAPARRTSWPTASKLAANVNMKGSKHRCLLSPGSFTAVASSWREVGTIAFCPLTAVAGHVAVADSDIIDTSTLVWRSCLWQGVSFISGCSWIGTSLLASLRPSWQHTHAPPNPYLSKFTTTNSARIMSDESGQEG